jgi:hypothetical protein
MTVIIPLTDKEKNPDELLTSLAKLDGASDFLQVICIAHPNTFRPESINAQYAPMFYDFKFIEHNFSSLAVAKNIGIKLAAGEILWFLSEYARPESTNLLEAIQLLHKQHGHVDIIWGKAELINKMEQSEKNETCKRRIFTSGVRFPLEESRLQQFQTRKLATPLLNVELTCLETYFPMIPFNAPKYIILKYIYQFIYQFICRIYFAIFHTIFCKIYGMAVYHIDTYILGDRENWKKLLNKYTIKF